MQSDTKEVSGLKFVIRERNGKITVLLDDGRNQEMLRLDISPKGFNEFRDELTQLLDHVVESVYQLLGDGVVVPYEEREFVREKFRLLAGRGHVALNKIFTRESLDIVRRATSSNSGLALYHDLVLPDLYNFPQAADWLTFPWEFIYSDYDPVSFAYDKFWGFSHIVHRFAFTGEPTSGEAGGEDEGGYSIGVIADYSLPQVRETEVPFLRTLDGIRLRELEIPTHLRQFDKRVELFQGVVKQFFSEEFHVIHLACHTREPDKAKFEPRSDGYCLLLSFEHDVSLWPSDFHLFRLTLGNRPLVILNACGTCPRNAEMTWNMVQVLVNRGARAVLATESKFVLDSVAAAFTCRLYPYLMQGLDIGRAAHSVRHTLLGAPYYNPLGLIYTLYAQPNTYLTHS